LAIEVKRLRRPHEHVQGRGLVVDERDAATQGGLLVSDGVNHPVPSFMAKKATFVSRADDVNPIRRRSARSWAEFSANTSRNWTGFAGCDD
jgi:hypothetical protein